MINLVIILNLFCDIAQFIDVFMNYLTPEYEKNCLAEYSNGDQEKIVFLNWGMINIFNRSMLF